jgi:hypothetical protein
MDLEGSYQWIVSCLYIAHDPLKEGEKKCEEKRYVTQNNFFFVLHCEHYYYHLTASVRETNCEICVLSSKLLSDSQ